jgi:hypothetical protein
MEKKPEPKYTVKIKNASISSIICTAAKVKSEKTESGTDALFLKPGETAMVTERGYEAAIKLFGMKIERVK